VREGNSDFLDFRVLHIGSYKYIKPDAGGKVCIYHSLNHFAEHCSVFAATVKHQEQDVKFKPVQLPVFGKSALRYINPIYIFKLCRIVKQHGIQCIILEHCYYAWLALIVKWICKVPLAIRSQNVEYLRFKTFGKWWWPILKQYELWSTRHADATLCITTSDAATYAAECPGAKCIDFPFGTTIKEMPRDKLACKDKICKELGLDADTTLLFFNGSLSYGPNRHGLDFILEHLTPVLPSVLPKYKLIICGGGLAAEYNNLAAYTAQNIIYPGFVDDIGTYFKAADVFLNPVVGGGGIKTKLIEAIAYGTAVVSSRDGAAGFDTHVAPAKIVVCPDDDVQAMCTAITSVLEKPYEATPASYYDHYYWGYNTVRVLHALKNIKK
jgi:polysaccharide biosynthesis protein PslH